jgi:hypothetical protein
MDAFWAFGRGDGEVARGKYSPGRYTYLRKLQANYQVVTSANLTDELNELPEKPARGSARQEQSGEQRGIDAAAGLRDQCTVVRT